LEIRNNNQIIRKSATLGCLSTEKLTSWLRKLCTREFSSRNGRTMLRCVHGMHELNFGYGGPQAGFVSCKKKNRNAKNMASAEARAYMGIWGRCPQRGPGAEPLVRGSGRQSPPDAEGILLPKRANLSLSFK